MERRGFKIGLISILVLIAGGCAAVPGRLEMDYGNSFRLAKAGQILNPEAGKNLEPVMGFDGQAAQIAIEKYREDFKKCVPVERAFTMTPVELGGSK